jgi:hypothetical protein
MSKVQEIERAVEQLPPKDFSELVEWIDQRRGKIVRDHGAFLNSYAPEDEGLYDDPVARCNLAGGNFFTDANRF